jgi:hypothetical protein
MMADELNINTEMIPTQTNGRAETMETHHAKASSRLVKIIPVFLLAFQLEMSHGYFNATQRRNVRA